MSTKPMATSEYMTPASSPPISTSKKKFASMSVSHSEIGPDHHRVGAHFGRGAFGDLGAVVEHHHVARDIHHHAHVVLDQHDRGAPLVVDVEDEARHVLLLFDVHPRH